MVVVLPAPLPPTKPVIRPGTTSKLTSSSTGAGAVALRDLAHFEHASTLSGDAQPSVEQARAPYRDRDAAGQRDIRLTCRWLAPPALAPASRDSAVAPSSSARCQRLREISRRPAAVFALSP